MYIIRLKDCKSVNMFFLIIKNYYTINALYVYVVEKIIIWETQIFFFQKYPFLYNQTGFSKTNNALQKRKKIILSTLKFWQEKLIWGLFFHEWKNKQINFASQILCVETYFFYTDVTENKIFRSSFSTSCWKTKEFCCI